MSNTGDDFEKLFDNRTQVESKQAARKPFTTNKAFNLKRGMLKLQGVMSFNPLLDTDHTLESELV